MPIMANRSTIVLYADPDDMYSHQVRIVLGEKDVMADVRPTTVADSQDLIYSLNPYGQLPILVDKELVIYYAPLILEYLDERFPHPPLLPGYPVARAESRKMIFRMEQDWYRLARRIQTLGKQQAAVARNQLKESLITLAPVFARKSFFLSDEFTLVDCYLLPLLWRLPILGIDLPPQAKAITAYAQRQFERRSFQASLGEYEPEMASV